MEITNQSSQNTRILKKIAKTIAPNYLLPNQVEVVFIDNEENSLVAEGVSYDYHPDNPGLGYIIIAINKTNNYPKITQYWNETPVVKLNSFEEEITLVLAHELRHNDAQFLQWDYADEADEEMDAENFAIRVLQAYKKSLTVKG